MHGGENYYAAPKAQITETNVIRRWGLHFWLVAVGSSVLSLCLGLFGSLAIPLFAEIFDSFGAEIPAATQFVITHNQWPWFALLVTVLMWIKWYRSKLERGERGRLVTAFLAIGVMDLNDPLIFSDRSIERFKHATS